MSQALQIARREYLETARSKWFIVGILTFPLLMAGLMFLPMLLITSGQTVTRCAVVDETGVLIEPLREALKNSEMLKSFELVPVPAEPGVVERLKTAVGREEYKAMLHLPAGVMQTEKAVYYARSLSVGSERLDDVLSNVVVKQRLAAQGFDTEKAAALTTRVAVDIFQVDDSGAQSKKNWGQMYLVSFTFVMMLYLTIAIYGVTIMNSTVQEKSSRVMEVLLSTTSPFGLMAGKLLGKGSAALTQLGIWTAAGLVFAVYGASSGSSGVSQIATSVSPGVFGWFLVFFVLGFFSMAAIYAACGSTCNTPEEATQLQFPAALPLIASLILSFQVISQPDNPVGVVLSLTPYLSPILMFVRIVVRTPPLWQILLAIVINLATIAGTVWIAARIYRIGVLMYGKRPTIPEIARWIRAT